MVVPLKIDVEELNRWGKHMANAATWFPRFLDANMEGLGRRVAYLMGQQIRRHKISGSLAESIKSSYDAHKIRLEIGPEKKYGGKWDAGLILQRGTRPIPNMPFGPIKEWAAFRGLPAGPIWMKIKQKGLDAHPFLKETLERGDTKVAIQNTAKRIGIDLAGGTLQTFPGNEGKQFTSTSRVGVFSG